MMSFYEKLSMKLQENAPTEPTAAVPAPVKSVSFNAAGVRNSPKTAVPIPVQEEPEEDATSLSVDLFQSDARMVIFVQMSGVTVDGFDIHAEEESNTVLIRATQKCPDVPLPKGAPPGTPIEKGRFVKQEIKWNNLYRKVYLPAPFDVAEAEAYLQRGVLIVVLPTKKPGDGRKLMVQELPAGEAKK